MKVNTKPLSSITNSGYPWRWCRLLLIFLFILYLLAEKKSEQKACINFVIKGKKKKKAPSSVELTTPLSRRARTDAINRFSLACYPTQNSTCNLIWSPKVLGFNSFPRVSFNSVLVSLEFFWKRGSHKRVWDIKKYRYLLLIDAGNAGTFNPKPLPHHCDHSAPLVFQPVMAILSLIPLRSL